MLKILQASLQQYMNLALPNVQAGFRKDRRIRDQTASILWIIRKAREFQKIIYFCFTVSSKTLTISITTNYGKFFKRWEYQINWTCLLRHLYMGQGVAVPSRRGITGWFQIGKGIRQCCVMSSCLFNLSAEYITWNARLDEAQAGIRFVRRNINKLRYSHDTTLMAES